MRFSTTFTTIALMAQMSLATWIVSSYESGCSESGKGGTLTAGSADDEIWCTVTSASHNIVAKGLEADNIQMWLFSSWDCSSEALIAEIDTDGCHVIPSDTVIEAVRVLPRS